LNIYSGPGNTITITAGANIAVNELVPVAELLGVAQSTVLSGAQVVLAIEGVFNLPKITGAIAVGEVVDYDTSADAVGRAITPASGDISDCGIAMETVASGAANVLVKLMPGNGAIT